jgi:MFS-type transporter involved in bile tolerance (Atg22 family)
VSIADLEWKSPFVAAVAIVRVSFSLAVFRSETYRFSRMAAANGFFTNGLFAWMTIYLPELFPTRVRGSAISLVFDSSRSVAALGPLLAGWLISSLGGIETAAAMMSFIYVVGLVVMPFAGPEPKGKPLPT